VTSDANVFEDLKSDINPYTNSTHEHVVGLAIQSGHNGGINHSSRELKLFKVSEKQPFQLILDNFMTDFHAAIRPAYECEDAESTLLKRHLVLFTSKTQGMQDIKFNEQLIRNSIPGPKHISLKSIKKAKSDHKISSSTVLI